MKVIRQRVSRFDIVGASVVMFLFVLWLAAPARAVDALDPEFLHPPEYSIILPPSNLVGRAVVHAGDAAGGESEESDDLEWSFNPWDEREVDKWATTKVLLSGAATLVGGWMAYDEVSEFDLRANRKERSAADALEAARRKGEISGRTTPPQVSRRFIITGTFSGSQIGAFVPALDFGQLNPGLDGGQINAAASADTQQGLIPGIGGGSWEQVDNDRIMIRGTTAFYQGPARVDGGQLILANGIRMGGGNVTVQDLERP